MNCWVWKVKTTVSNFYVLTANDDIGEAIEKVIASDALAGHWRHLSEEEAKDRRRESIISIKHKGRASG